MEGIAFSKEKGIIFYEGSAITGEDVQKLIEDIVITLLIEEIVITLLSYIMSNYCCFLNFILIKKFNLIISDNTKV